MHLQTVNRILQYLKGSPGKVLLFKRGGDMVLEAYTDADYVGSLHHFRPTATPRKCRLNRQKVWPLIKGYTFGHPATLFRGFPKEV